MSACVVLACLPGFFLFSDHPNDPVSPSAFTGVYASLVPSGYEAVVCKRWWPCVVSDCVKQ